MIFRNKKAAMEMSVGTIVTIVLLMTVLILGLVLVRSIFSSSTSSVDEIDKAVKEEISKLFAEDSSKKLILFPANRNVEIKKGEVGKGFALSIRNVGSEEAKFSYDIKAVETNCGMRLSEADSLFSLNQKRGDLIIPAGNVMENPILVTLDIPENAPPCSIVYAISLKKGAENYGAPVDIYINIRGK
jgi:hypothetical protein